VEETSNDAEGFTKLPTIPELIMLKNLKNLRELSQSQERFARRFKKN
jgi:hypothetical protein